MYGNFSNDFEMFQKFKQFMRNSEQQQNNQPQQQQFMPQQQMQIPIPLQQAQPVQPMQPQQPTILFRYVNKKGEAEYSQIDPFNVHMFINRETGEIYSRLIDNNGKEQFTTYIPQSQQQEKTDPTVAITERLDRIENMLKDGVLNVSDATAKSNAKSTAKPTANANENQSVIGQ